MTEKAKVNNAFCLMSIWLAIKPTIIPMIYVKAMTTALDAISIPF